jgi:hypothetical protein
VQSPRRRSSRRTWQHLRCKQLVALPHSGRRDSGNRCAVSATGRCCAGERARPGAEAARDPPLHRAREAGHTQGAERSLRTARHARPPAERGSSFPAQVQAVVEACDAQRAHLAHVAVHLPARLPSLAPEPPAAPTGGAAGEAAPPAPRPRGKENAGAAGHAESTDADAAAEKRRRPPPPRRCSSSVQQQACFTGSFEGVHGMGISPPGTAVCGAPDSCSFSTWRQLKGCPVRWQEQAAAAVERSPLRYACSSFFQRSCGGCSGCPECGLNSEGALLGPNSGWRALQVRHAGRAGVAVVLHDAAPDAGQGAAAPARCFVRGRRQPREAPEPEPVLLAQQLRGGLRSCAVLHAGDVAHQLNAPDPGAWAACFMACIRRPHTGGVRGPAR